MIYEFIEFIEFSGYIYSLYMFICFIEVSINGRSSIAGWFISWKVHLLYKWMITRGTPILGNLHMTYEYLRKSGSYAIKINETGEALVFAVRDLDGWSQLAG